MSCPLFLSESQNTRAAGLRCEERAGQALFDSFRPLLKCLPVGGSPPRVFFNKAMSSMVKVPMTSTRIMKAFDTREGLIYSLLVMCYG